MALKLGDTVQCWTNEINFLGWGEIVGIGPTVIFVLIGRKLYQADEYYCIPEKKAFEISKKIERDLSDI